MVNLKIHPFENKNSKKLDVSTFWCSALVSDNKYDFNEPLSLKFLINTLINGTFRMQSFESKHTL